MTLSELRDALAAYYAVWTDEGAVVDRFLDLLDGWPACLGRDHLPGHITASGWVVHPDTDAVLLTHHRKLDKWLQLGGHVDGDADVAAAAAREVREESGITAFVAADPTRFFDVDVHAIPPYGATPAHDHYDLRFLFHAARRDEPVVSDESHDVAWVPLDQLERYTTEGSMLRMRDKWWTLMGRSRRSR